jgi:hypothetical protein
VFSASTFRARVYYHFQTSFRGTVKEKTKEQELGTQTKATQTQRQECMRES